MKNKQFNKRVITLAGPILTFVTLVFLVVSWAVDNTKEDIRLLDAKIDKEIREVRQEIFEVRNLLIDELRGKTQSQPTNG